MAEWHPFSNLFVVVFFEKLFKISVLKRCHTYYNAVSQIMFYFDLYNLWTFCDSINYNNSKTLRCRFTENYFC